MSTTVIFRKRCSFFCVVKFPLKTLNICPDFAYTDMKAVFSFTGGSHVCTAPDNITRVKLTNLVPMLDNIWHSTAKQQQNKPSIFTMSNCAFPSVRVRGIHLTSTLSVVGLQRTVQNWQFGCWQWSLSRVTWLFPWSVALC